MKGAEVETEEQQLTVTYWIPRELSGERRLAIFRRFRPLHDRFQKIVQEECRKDGYAPIRGRTEGK